MKNSRFWFIPVMLLSMILYSQASWAAKAYIVDTKEVPIRSAPNPQSKPISLLQPGAGIDILRESEWTLIRFQDAGGKTRDGWVPTRALGARPPEETLTRELQNENAALNERLAVLEKEKTDLQQKEKTLTEKLSKLENDYEKLKGGSASYMALRDEHEATKVSLASAQDDITMLKQENDNLRLSHRVTWFGAGAFVLFCGLLIGWFTGRHQKKRRVIYFM